MPANSITFDVDWADCDPAGIVFYPQFFRMMNTGTHRLFADAGLAYIELTRRYTPFGTPLLDVQSSFRSPARFGDRITLESSIAEVREKTFLVDHVMKAAGRVVFEAREVRVWAIPDETKPNGMRAVPIPAEIRELLGRWTQ